jgi:hypothetical protein
VRRVHHPRRHRRLLGELADGGALLDHVVGDRHQAARAVGAEPDALDRRRAVAGDGEHLLARDRDLHRPVHQPCRHHREDDVRHRPALGAEPATHVGGHHPDLLWTQTERPGHGLLHPRRALVGVVERDRVAVPDGQGGVWLHRVVVDRRGLVGAVDGHLRGRQRLVAIALLGVGLKVRVDPGRPVQAWMAEAQLDVVRLLGVADADKAFALPRRLVAVGNHGGDDLAAVGDAAGLEQRQLVVVDPVQPRRVLARQDGEDTRQGEGGRRVHALDRSLGDRGRHDRRVGDLVVGVLVGVPGGPGHLLGPFHAVGCGQDRPGGRDGHGASFSSSSVRTIRLRATGSL